MEVTQSAIVGSPRRVGVQVRLEWCVPNRAVQKVRRLVTRTILKLEWIGENKPTWMLSRSIRQFRVMMVSHWLGAGAIERDLPPNRREMCDSTEPACSHPSIRQQRQDQFREKNNWPTV